MNSWAIQLPTWTRLVVSGGGLVTGLVGLGVGPVTNTVLSRGTDIGVHRAIGTATLTLYLTVLAAAMTTLLLVPFGGLVGVAPSIPWSVATVVAPVVLFGGQLGPWINARLPERSIVRSLVGLYLLVAVVTVLRVVG